MSAPRAKSEQGSQESHLVEHQAQSARPQPNVLMILTDDQGYGDLSCHGNPWLRTPELDRLHGDSVRLTDFHVDPMCAPTRAALLTGRYSARTGVWSTLRGRYIMNRDETTMAEVFAASGYATGMFGKWHLGDSWPYRPFDRGFQESLSFGGGVVGEIPDHWDNDYFHAVYERNGVPERFDDRYCTDVWFDEATAFIERNQGRSFFCYIPTNAPHNPFNVADRYSDPYLAMDVPEKRAKFYGMIACIDERVGRLRRRLGELGIARDTIVIFMGDNGSSGGADIDRRGFLKDGYNAGMRGRKCWAFEGGHRNSCFIHWPNGELQGGRDVDALSAHIDLFPTLVSLCELQKPNLEFDGRDLMDLLTGGKQDHDDDRVLVVHNQQKDNPVKLKDFEVMTRRWRLAQTNDWGPGDLELFDQQADPGQERNLLLGEPDVADQLQTEYEAWWQHVGGRFEDVSPIFIGGEQNPVPITCHAWHGEKGLYNQWHVRPGLVDNGWWPLEVVTAGIYEFELRRWPRDANAAICATLPPRRNVPFVDDFVPGEALAIRMARIRVGNAELEASVKQDEVCKTFRFTLPRGTTRLETFFTDAEGVVRGAYYVYVTKVTT